MPVGEVSSSTTSTGSPINASANSPGRPIVAEVKMKVGSAPYNAATRRRRRSTLAL